MGREYKEEWLSEEEKEIIAIEATVMAICLYHGYCHFHDAKECINRGYNIQDTSWHAHHYRKGPFRLENNLSCDGTIENVVVYEYEEVFRVMSEGEFNPLNDEIEVYLPGPWIELFKKLSIEILGR